jgi:hypothetical protein
MQSCALRPSMQSRRSRRWSCAVLGLHTAILGTSGATSGGAGGTVASRPTPREPRAPAACASPRESPPAPVRIDAYKMHQIDDDDARTPAAIITNSPTLLATSSKAPLPNSSAPPRHHLPISRLAGRSATAASSSAGQSVAELITAETPSCPSPGDSRCPLARLEKLQSLALSMVARSAVAVAGMLRYGKNEEPTAVPWVSSIGGG